MGGAPHVLKKKLRGSFLLSTFFMNSLLFFHVILFFFVILLFLLLCAMETPRERESCVLSVNKTCVWHGDSPKRF
jgi:hypothetical protein